MCIRDVLTQIDVLIHKSEMSMNNGLFALTMSLNFEMKFNLRYLMGSMKGRKIKQTREQMICHIHIKNSQTKKKLFLVIFLFPRKSNITRTKRNKLLTFAILFRNYKYTTSKPFFK